MADIANPRTCALQDCGAILTRHGNEKSWDFARRKHCGVPCASKAARGARPPLAPTLRVLDLIEEIEFLRGTDSPESLARRLGYPIRESLASVLSRAQRYDLASLFHRAA